MFHTLAFLQGQEIWVVLIVILVLFGGKKIPELMRGVGRGVGELQRGIEEGKRAMEREAHAAIEEDAKGSKASVKREDAG